MAYRFQNGITLYVKYKSKDCTVNVAKNKSGAGSFSARERREY
ncbi:MAG: hypothetical protein Q4A21_01415 [bacterium]|nr:hypothetical protein [bacterium]